MSDIATGALIKGKVLVKGEMEVVTGIHIGASKDNMKIGDVDSPVVRDPITNFPYIPGSSLKGKMRSNLEKICAPVENYFNRRTGSKGFRHECDEANDSCPVCRLFGSSSTSMDKSNQPARIIVRDLFLTEKGKKLLESVETGLQYTEWKFENSIDRITSAANPRQIERVPAGVRFGFEMIYTVETSYEHAKEDIENLKMLMKMLEDDYLGGHGSRGYGKVKFHEWEMKWRSVDSYLGKEDETELTEDALRIG